MGEALSSYKGLQKGIRKLKIESELEVIENEYSGEEYTIELRTEEFTTICPKTGLPDFATLLLQYKPDEYLVEQKSLKLYLSSYRSVGIFQEHATNKVFEDFIDKVKPKWAKITCIWNTRGGIKTKVEREYFKKEK